MMKKDKEKALLLPPYEFEVCLLCSSLPLSHALQQAMATVQVLPIEWVVLLGGGQAQIRCCRDMQSLCQIQWR